LRRLILPSGKSRAFINDQPVNLAALRGIVGRVVELHGQHDGQLLLDTRMQREVLDRYAQHTPRVEAFAQSVGRLRRIANEMADLRAKEAEATRQLEYLQYQFAELEKANLDEDEEQRLEAELKLLENAEQICVLLAEAQARLESDEMGVMVQLTEAERRVGQATQLGAPLADTEEALENSRHTLAEAVDAIRRALDRIEANPERLFEVQARLDVYNRLKMKYGTHTAAGLLSLQASLAEQIEAFCSIETRIAQLEAEHAALADALGAEALAIEAERLAAATHLAQQVCDALVKVGLPKADFRVECPRLAPEDKNLTLTIAGSPTGVAPWGINRVQFLISANPGQAPGPLERIASGGELSRVMLALKAALAEKMQLAVLIFDEIDTGISGEVALKVGRVMEGLATTHQILSITHLPQIASRQARHFFIYKEQGPAHTHSRVRTLADDERTTEIAKMLSGETPTPAALSTARDLLATR
jgi:DNA repair protein RecN (Recombination protein N)